MKKWLLLAILCSAEVLTVQGQNYAVSNIPYFLRQNANQVVRSHKYTFEVINKSKAVSTEHMVITLLNPNAEAATDQTFYYDKIIKIEKIEGAVYDAEGKLVRKIKSKDVQDQKMLEYFVSDGRVMNMSFPRLPFPYTIEYTIVRKYEGLMFYPVFMPQGDAETAVEFALFELKQPDNMAVRVKELNLPATSKSGPYIWAFQNLPAFKMEPYMPDPALYFPMVLTAPTEFALEGYEGEMSSWESYGRFIAQLNEGKAILPAATIEKLRALTADCPNDRCKVERVYAFLQDNTRYFFVGLGIGGWQPSPAKEVDQYKYGDCKGLSNYTVAMLQAVGVNAYYALIRAGDDEQHRQFPDFPNAWFNHAIACAVVDRDTVWLECTSQQGSCGYMSDFTDNRPALLITPEGGKLVKTPRYDQSVNTIRRVTRMHLNPDGSAKLQSEDVYKGIAQNNLFRLSTQHDEVQKKAFYELIQLKDFEITALKMTPHKGPLPEVHCRLELTAPKFAAASGKRLFIPVAAQIKSPEIPLPDSLRRFPVQANSRGFDSESELVIEIPEGYTLENAVVPQRFSSAFGEYELNITNEPGGLLVIKRKLTLNDSIQPKEKYQEFWEFLKNVGKADKTKLVLAKGT